jgi:ligand-binding sensor domain-containing protein
LVQYNIDENQAIVYKKYNSILGGANGDPNSTRVPDLTFDANGNLWMTNHLATKPIVVKKADGNWKNFSNNYSSNSLTKIIVDQNDQKWILVDGDGMLVYNSGADIDNTSDDQYRHLQKGAGYGNLPSNHVNALAEDKDGQIWIGTDAGVGVFYNASTIIQGGDAQQIIVSNPTDSIANYLFAAENITDIKVDGANRKWVSSEHGVWLMSSDGLKEVYHFTKDNSPLLSDNVFSIGINNTTGEVFFATDLGMCSFRSDATKGGDANNNVVVFPNPVPHDYNGTIAIRGLVDDAYVKITDINGQLIYSTKALGGQAVWNGKNLQGIKTASGVYLVFATNSTGSETVVSKILYDK